MKSFYIVISSLLVCSLLAFIEHGIEINYLIKTGFKIGLFFLVIWTYIQLFKDFRFKHPVSIHKMVKKEWIRVIALGVSSAVIVLLAYILLQPVLDMAKIKEDLVERLGITKTGFLFVGLYISLGNSFLEEYFFRGFIFFNLPRRLGYIYSPLLFSAYHIPMIMLWFSSVLIIVCFIGLWLVGLLFHKVNEKNGTIWASWVIHICADIIIILIGTTLFY
ncbi:CPBP family intramembrane glutamic endopeptidase [Virgibacillus sp. DJP39]|uniref:CPBP family intramembrane glutamic endopeptidase n=1 Tax=Virgibacillus sp. DJP39 TaxID=3409790 RepID=UPI003BB7F418